MPSATATVLRAFIRTSWVPLVSLVSSGAARPRAGRIAFPSGGTVGDHAVDVVPGELEQGVATARLGAHQQSQNEIAVLLEEEHVARLLFIDVLAEHAQRLFIVARGRGRDRNPLAASSERFVHEPRDVVVKEGQGFLDLL